MAVAINIALSRVIVNSTVIKRVINAIFIGVELHGWIIRVLIHVIQNAITIGIALQRVRTILSFHQVGHFIAVIIFIGVVAYSIVVSINCFIGVARKKIQVITNTVTIYIVISVIACTITILVFAF